MSKVLFFLGAGPRIGRSVAKKFKSEGYKVAVGSRRPNVEQAKSDGFLAVSVDVTKPEAVQTAFAKVKQELGTPNVVVYNAAALTLPKDANDPMELTSEDFEKDTAVNLFGAFSSMREAIQGFKSLSDEETPKAFIATGNIIPFQPRAASISLGAGKAGVVHLIQSSTLGYSKLGYRFYFASQVTDDGGPVPYPDVNGEIHGKVYYDLVQDSKGVREPWDVRFTKIGML